MILALFDRLGVTAAERFDHIHGLVEATKRALRVRDRAVTDPNYVVASARALPRGALHRRRGDENRPPQGRALAARAGEGDTIWMGAADATRPGRVLHPIALLGVRLRLRAAAHRRADAESRRELFAADPARSTCWSPAGCRSTRSIPRSRCSMTGASWPMAAWAATASRRRRARLFTRHVRFGQPLADAIDRPRWVLGRTWGASRTSLRLEPRFDGNLVEALVAAGHDVEILQEPYSESWAMPARPCCIPTAPAKARTIRAPTAGGGRILGFGSRTFRRINAALRSAAIFGPLPLNRCRNGNDRVSDRRSA